MSLFMFVCTFGLSRRKERGNMQKRGSRLKHIWWQIQFKIHCFQILMCFSVHSMLYTNRITEHSSSPNRVWMRISSTCRIHRPLRVNCTKKPKTVRKNHKNREIGRATKIAAEESKKCSRNERTHACTVAQERTFFSMLSLWAIITNNPSNSRCRRPPCCWETLVSA